MFVFVGYDAFWICKLDCCVFCAYVCVWVCVCRPQHTNDRLIKQLIKAREIGSEISLLLFGKNGSTHHKKEGARRTGRAEKRKKVGDRVSEPLARNVSKSVLWRPPPPFLHPYSPFLLLH